MLFVHKLLFLDYDYVFALYEEITILIVYISSVVSSSPIVIILFLRIVVVGGYHLSKNLNSKLHNASLLVVEIESDFSHSCQESTDVRR